ncbi:MFS transporter [Deinococcus detaillensis]|uniref:MFS transporter n=1 Tax=Deinococcus detaillensis TaxID=2592048 RepID=UPI001CDB90B9|nr:MFS transporter [Deinococcus detaillensis]
MRAAQRLHALPFGVIGALLFLNVYAPQSLLPVLAREFGVSSAQVGTVIGSTTLAMALFAPFAGLIADALGRRRVTLGAFALLLLPSLLATQAHTLASLNLARFAQGLLIPLVMVAVSAYLAEEAPPARFARLLTAYVTGTIVGGFAGRLLSGVAEHAGNWHLAFWLLLLTNLLGVGVALLGMPKEKHFTPQRRPREAGRILVNHLRNPALLLTCAVGFLILFVLVSVFNTVTLRLAAPPYVLGSGPIGLIFAVYLLGAVVTPVTAPALSRRGPLWALRAAVLTSLAGLCLTLLTPLPLLIAGLAVAACGVFLAQAAALSAVQSSIRGGRSLANGLYNFTYYGGASVASVLAGAAYDWRGWNAVAALCMVAMLGAGWVGQWGWRNSAA